MGGGSYGTLTLTFSQAMDASTVTTPNLSSALTLSNGHTFGTGATVSWNAADTVLTIGPGSGATVAHGDTITLTGVTDVAVNPTVSPVTLPAP